MGSTARVYESRLVDEWTANAVWSGLVGHSPTIPDYESLDTMMVSEPAQLRALGDDIRTKIVALLRDRAASTTELAARLGIPKGTAGHHVKVLERAGLVKVVRTRQVRAVTERYYGRVARLFLIRCDDESDKDALVPFIAATQLRSAADELTAAGIVSTQGLIHTRLSPADTRRFVRRLEKLVSDFRTSEDPDGEPMGLAIALYPQARQDAADA
jgi:DNA-binding transcriptional ArsR family regulator